MEHEKTFEVTISEVADEGQPTTDESTLQAAIEKGLNPSGDEAIVVVVCDIS
jgi:hypothetical protein